jgi:ferritin-like metal-binding protein YciE
MAMEDPREMFLHELADIFDAEHKLTTALERMAKKVSNQNLKSLLEDHLEETEGQIKRLEMAFKNMDQKPKRQPCKGMSGLIEEFQHFVKEEKPEPALLDVYAVGAAIKVEHYEISSYQSMIEMAKTLGLEEEAAILEENLKEEQAALQKLQTMGQELLTDLPPMESEDDEGEEMEAEESEMEEEKEETASSGNKRKASR